MRELREIIASGDAMLFTGAGFSADARDLDGNPLPTSEEMRRELWPLVFGENDPDESSLQDLYDVALARAPARLRDYVCRRLRIGDAPLPAYYKAWFAAPWRRIYTLNVDDLEVAVARQFRVARKDVVHLNGIAGSDVAQLTFSTLQYAARLCSRDREYERLVEDLARAPFVFAGTTLDEITLWKHLELHRRTKGHQTSQPSFLVSRDLPRARRLLLEDLGIRWVRATIEEIAEQMLA
jgi:hypothetical protein